MRSSTPPPRRKSAAPPPPRRKSSAPPPPLPDDAMFPRMMRVLRTRRETHDVFSFELDAAEYGGFRFEPGQFNMLYVPGAGESAISVSGDPRRGGRLVHTIREVGNVTRALGKLHRGDMVGVRGPFGFGWPLAEARGRDVVVVAGGVGLAPLRPVLYAISHRRDDYRRVSLVYGSRSPGDLLYRRELSRWRVRLGAQVWITVDRADQHWFGHTGVVTKLLDAVELDPDNAIAMLCGPEVMMRFSARELEGRGVGLDRVYLSLERNMECGIGLCGHCQIGPHFACKDGPVYRYETMARFMRMREV